MNVCLFLINSKTTAPILLLFVPLHRLIQEECLGVQNITLQYVSWEPSCNQFNNIVDGIKVFRCLQLKCIL